MKGRPRVGAGVRNPALDRGRIPTALGRPSALREARAVRVRANHGPPSGADSRVEERRGSPRAGPAPGFARERLGVRGGGPAPDQRRGRRRLPV